MGGAVPRNRASTLHGSLTFELRGLGQVSQPLCPVIQGLFLFWVCFEMWRAPGGETRVLPGPVDGMRVCRVSPGSSHWRVQEASSRGLAGPSGAGHGRLGPTISGQLRAPPGLRLGRQGLGGPWSGRGGSNCFSSAEGRTRPQLPCEWFRGLGHLGQVPRPAGPQHQENSLESAHPSTRWLSHSLVLLPRLGSSLFFLRKTLSSLQQSSAEAHTPVVRAALWGTGQWVPLLWLELDTVGFWGLNGGDCGNQAPPE